MSALTPLNSIDRAQAQGNSSDHNSHYSLSPFLPTGLSPSTTSSLSSLSSRAFATFRDPSHPTPAPTPTHRHFPDTSYSFSPSPTPAPAPTHRHFPDTSYSFSPSLQTSSTSSSSRSDVSSIALGLDTININHENSPAGSSSSSRVIHKGRRTRTTSPSPAPIITNMRKSGTSDSSATSLEDMCMKLYAKCKRLEMENEKLRKKIPNILKTDSVTSEITFLRETLDRLSAANSHLNQRLIAYNQSETYLKDMFRSFVEDTLKLDSEDASVNLTSQINANRSIKTKIEKWYQIYDRLNQQGNFDELAQPSPSTPCQLN